MDKSIVGFVFHVTKLDNGNIEVDFHNTDDASAVSYSTNASKGGKLPKEFVQTLAGTLGHNIWTKIHSNEKGVATKVGLEEYDFEKDSKHLKEKLSNLLKTGR